MMARLIAMLMVLALALPCWGAMPRISWNDAAQTRSMAVTGRSSAEAQVATNGQSASNAAAYAPRSQRMCCVGTSGDPIYDTLDPHGEGVEDDTHLITDPLRDPAIIPIGIDETHSLIIGRDAAARDIYQGAIGATTIEWVKIGDISETSAGEMKAAATDGVDADSISRVCYRAVVVGTTKLLLFWGLESADQDGETLNCRIYKATWSGTAWGTWEYVGGNVYGPPSPANSVAVSGDDIIYGSYHIEGDEFATCDAADNCVDTAWFSSSDAGETWETIDIYDPEVTAGEPWTALAIVQPIHCHSASFGSDANTAFFSHGDHQGPILKFTRTAGVWSAPSRVDPGSTVSSGAAMACEASACDMVYYNGQLYTTTHQMSSTPTDNSPWPTLFSLDSATTDATTGRWAMMYRLQVPSYNVTNATSWPYEDFGTTLTAGLLRIDGLFVAGVADFTSSKKAKTGYGLYVSPDGIHWTCYLTANYLASEDPAVHGVLYLFGKVSGYIVGMIARTDDPGGTPGAQYCTVLIPFPSVRLVDAWVVQASETSVLDAGLATGVFSGSFESASTDIAASDWVIHDDYSATGTSTTPATGGFLGSRYLKCASNANANDTDTSMVKVAKTFGTNPSNGDRISVVYWNRMETVLSGGRAITAAPYSSAGVIPAYTYSFYGGQRPSYNWSQRFSTGLCNGALGGGVEGIFLFWRADACGAGTPAASGGIDAITAIYNANRWYSYSLLPYAPCNAADPWAGYSIPAETVTLPVPSTSNTWTFTCDWWPLEADLNFANADFTVFTLVDASGNSIKVDWDVSANKFLLTDSAGTPNTATSAAAFYFLHWEQIKFGLSIEDGEPVSFFVWSPKSGYIDALDISGLVQMSGPLSHVILGAGPTYGTVGVGRYANVRAYDEALDADGVKAEFAKVDPITGTLQAVRAKQSRMEW